MTALMTAAMSAIPPAINETVLIIPPRTLGEAAMTIPMIAAMMATTASIKPQKAPVVKLSNAAIIAMIDGMLNLAGRVSCAFMTQPTGGFVKCNRWDSRKRARDLCEAWQTKRSASLRPGGS